MADDAIVEARERGHTNLYLNYLRLSEIPDSLLALHGVKNVYLKYNIITKLVSVWLCICSSSTYFPEF